MFTMKCELYFNSNTFIIVLFVVSVTILAFILRVFELPFEQSVHQKSLQGYKIDITDFGSAIWLTVITITTVGYGDIWPHTAGG
jgi:voltage-gated potassium channel Kch